MKAIVIHSAQDLRLEERPVEPLKSNQVEIRIAMGGICGSDLHYFRHGGFGSIQLKEPLILGHEVSGYVAAIADDVQGLKIGQLVSVMPSRPCHNCTYCKEAIYNQCLNMQFYGSAMPFPHSQGAFREVLTVEAFQCIPADGLSPEEAAMAEPLAVCLHAVKRAGQVFGKSVMVTGCGPIGILCILAARRAGARKIVATDLSDFALEIAKKAGADQVVNMKTKADSLDAYKAEKGQFDLLFECSGAEIALTGAIPMIRAQGRIIQLGLGNDMTLPMQAITAKEIELCGSFRFHEEFEAAVHFMQKGLIDVKPLITQKFALDDAIKAFEIAGDRDQAIKAQIRFSEPATNT